MNAHAPAPLDSLRKSSSRAPWDSMLADTVCPGRSLWARTKALALTVGVVCLAAIVAKHYWAFGSSLPITGRGASFAMQVGMAATMIIVLTPFIALLAAPSRFISKVCAVANTIVTRITSVTPVLGGFFVLFAIWIIPILAGHCVGLLAQGVYNVPWLLERI